MREREIFRINLTVSIVSINSKKGKKISKRKRERKRERCEELGEAMIPRNITYVNDMHYRV